MRCGIDDNGKRKMAVVGILTIWLDKCHVLPIALEWDNYD